MVGVTLRDQRTAEWVRKQIWKWTWAGHVMRRTDNRWTVRATEWLPRDGKRSRGRQRARWSDKIKEVRRDKMEPARTT